MSTHTVDNSREGAPRATKPLNYTITPSLPSVEEYLALRDAAGLTVPPVHLPFARGLATSLHCLVARLNDTDSAAMPAPPATITAGGQTSGTPTAGRAVGMVRLVGDGVIFCSLHDMCVDPAFQGQGVGRALLNAMVAWIDENAPDAYVSLIADPGNGPALYGKAGFAKSTGVGMARCSYLKQV